MRAPPGSSRSPKSSVSKLDVTKNASQSKISPKNMCLMNLPRTQTLTSNSALHLPFANMTIRPVVTHIIRPRTQLLVLRLQLRQSPSIPPHENIFITTPTSIYLTATSHETPPPTRWSSHLPPQPHPHINPLNGNSRDNSSRVKKSENSKSRRLLLMDE